MKHTAKRIYVVGTFDTKAPELAYLARHLQKQALPFASVDISTDATTQQVDFTARQIAGYHLAVPRRFSQAIGARRSRRWRRRSRGFWFSVKT